MTIQKMTRISLFAALICIATIIIPPIPILGIPVTLQTLMIMLTAIILNPKEAFLAVFIYVLIGIVGLPVFSGFKSGIDAILGPTGGFIVSFPFVAFLISYFKGKLSLSRLILINIIFGIGFVYFIGIIFYSHFTESTIPDSINAMLIFIPIDVIKAIIASFIGKRIIEYKTKYSS